MRKYIAGLIGLLVSILPATGQDNPDLGLTVPERQQIANCQSSGGIWRGWCDYSKSQSNDDQSSDIGLVGGLLRMYIDKHALEMPVTPADAILTLCNERNQAVNVSILYFYGTVGVAQGPWKLRPLECKPTVKFDYEVALSLNASIQSGEDLPLGEKPKLFAGCDKPFMIDYFLVKEKSDQVSRTYRRTPKSKAASDSRPDCRDKHYFDVGEVWKDTKFTIE